MRTPAIAVAVALLLTAAANASFISYDGSLTFNKVGDQTLYLDQFDPSLGALTGVTIYVAHSGGAFFRVDNNDANPADAFANMERAWTITDSGFSFSDSHTTTTSPVHLSANDGDAGGNWTGADSYIWPNVSFSDGPVGYTVASGYWGAYQGLGNIGLLADVTNYVNSLEYIDTPPNDVLLAIGSLPSGGLRLDMRVEYEYQDGEYVPEPGTMALVGLGLAGLGVWRRRRAAA